jgi:nucleoside-diphosphate-sugar epimerase
LFSKAHAMETTGTEEASRLRVVEGNPATRGVQTVLVTGGSGFIGRNLVRELVRRTYRVRCLVRATSQVEHLRADGVEICLGDLCQPECLHEAVAGVDTVFHIAGLVAATRAEQMMRVNGEGTWNVASACAACAKPPVLVTVSSLAAAGPVPEGSLRQESDPPLPVSRYGHSKRAGELAARAWADRVPTTIVRPGIVFGPEDRLLLPMFRSIARLGIHPVPTFDPPPLSLIHVADLVEILLRAAARGTRIGGETNGKSSGAGCYFACSDEHPTYAELGRLVADAVGRKHVLLLHLAEPLAWLVGGVAELISQVTHQPLAVNLDKMRESIQPSWAASPRGIRAELEFAEPYSLAQRMSQTVTWYRERGWL